MYKKILPLCTIASFICPAGILLFGETIREFRIAADSKGKELASFALAMHNLIKLPLTIRTLNEKGLRIEDGKIIDDDFTGPVLEQVLRDNKFIRTIPKTGVYKGKSVIAAPIQDAEGNVVAAIGLSDAYGAIDFIDCFCKGTAKVDDVMKCLVEKRIKK